MSMSKIFSGALLFYTAISYSATCPNLHNGKIPSPWEKSPGSSEPYFDKKTHFKEASILVISGEPIEVFCSYENGHTRFTIYNKTHVKLAFLKKNKAWHETHSGYICSTGIFQCAFYPYPYPK